MGKGLEQTFSKKDIHALQVALKERKRYSAVIAVRCSELTLMKGADIAFACDLIDYPSSKLQDALFEDLPDDFECPLCLVGKDEFSEV